jgi:hypothetical protein
MENATIEMKPIETDGASQVCKELTDLQLGWVGGGINDPIFS